MVLVFFIVYHFVAVPAGQFLLHDAMLARYNVVVVCLIQKSPSLSSHDAENVTLAISIILLIKHPD